MGEEAWTEAEKMAKETAGGMFLRLKKSGDAAVVLFLGDPKASYGWFNQKTRRFETWTDEHEKAGHRKTSRMKINCYVPAQDKVLIWEMAGMTFQDLVVMRGKYGLEKQLYEIRREGEDESTRYKVLPDPGKGLPPIDEIVTRAKTHKIHDLTKVEDPGEEAASGTTAPAASAGGAGAAIIDAATANQIIGRIKNMPEFRDKAVKFTSHFGIAKVSELPSAKLPDALRFLEQLEGPKPTAAASTPDDALA